GAPEAVSSRCHRVPSYRSTTPLSPTAQPRLPSAPTHNAQRFLPLLAPEAVSSRCHRVPSYRSTTPPPPTAQPRLPSASNHNAPRFWPHEALLGGPHRKITGPGGESGATASLIVGELRCLAQLDKPTPATIRNNAHNRVNQVLIRVVGRARIG